MSRIQEEINTGLRIGKLLVGDLVRNVQQHELFEETPISYLQQGRLREVVCDCGKRRLIAESILATGRIKSCGCLRASMISGASNRKLEKLQVKADKALVTSTLAVEQQKLKMLQKVQVPARDEKAIQECMARIRSLIARRAILTKKYQRIGYAIWEPQGTKD